MSAKRMVELAEELHKMMLKGVKQAEKLDVPISNDKNYFVTYKGKEYVNPKHFRVHQQMKVVQLCRFVRAHPEIQESDLRIILNLCQFQFSLYRDIQRLIPNLVEEIRSHDDEKYICGMYSAIKVFREQEMILG